MSNHCFTAANTFCKSNYSCITTEQKDNTPTTPIKHFYNPDNHQTREM